MPTTILGWMVGSIPLAMVAAVFYAILRGHLVPKVTVDALVTNRDKQIEELGRVLDLWREAAQAKDEAIREFIPMLTEITENDKLIIKLLGAIREVIDDPSKEAS